MNSRLLVEAGSKTKKAVMIKVPSVSPSIITREERRQVTSSMFIVQRTTFTVLRATAGKLTEQAFHLQVIMEHSLLVDVISNR